MCAKQKQWYQAETGRDFYKNRHKEELSASVPVSQNYPTLTGVGQDTQTEIKVS